jgi:AraC-like DNA-binding protein
LKLPFWLILENLEGISLPVLPRILGKQGLGAALFQLATSLYEQAEFMPADEGMIALEAYLHVLAGCLARPETSSTQLVRCAQLRPRIEHYIETHLAERTLTPATIAGNAGISVRHLHRLFAFKGCTVEEWIRERRLERCRVDLVNPGLLGCSITDIAFRWGFNDSAHFSHCFKNAFGMSPRQFRTSALTRSATLQCDFRTSFPESVHN